MKRWLHWLMHDWLPWSTYVMHGEIVKMPFTNKPCQPTPFSETRQRRSCRICGYSEDEILVR